MLSEKHRCIEDNYSNNGNIFQSAFQIPSAAMCQFECQNVKGLNLKNMTFMIYYSE